MQNCRHKFEIITCLDGTTDNSQELLQSFDKFYPTKVLPIKNERGLGRAYKRIFLEVINNSSDDDLVISLDADNTHNPEQISQMLQHLETNNLDVVIASRFCDTSFMSEFPVYRKFISKFTSLLLQNLFGIKTIQGKKLQDFTSGYRVYKVEKLKKLFALKKDNFITEPEFTYTCELLIKLAKIGCLIDEIPISYDYGQKVGASKLRVMRNLQRLIVMLFNFLIRR